MKDAEHHLQKTIFQWAAIEAIKRPELTWMFAIPNGGHRNKRTAGRMKAEGVKAGVVDIFLPVARGGFYGMFAECKIKPNRLTKDQVEFLFAMENQGYKTTVWWTFEQAIDEITKFLNGWIVKGY